MSPPGDCLEALARRILPVMDEHGLCAFVLVGYVQDGDGKLTRVCIAQTGHNPAYEDGLRPVINFAQMWGAAPQQFVPPPQDHPNEQG